MQGYDIVVIGSGLGGLSAAALIARGGRRVLVLERNESLGGAATVYTHGRLTIEASLHETDALGTSDPNHGLVHRLGIADKVSLVPTPEIYEVRSPCLEQPFRLPEGWDAAREAGHAAFPAHRRGVDRYFDAVEGIGRAYHALAEPTEHRFREILGAIRGGDLWQLIRRVRASTSGAMHDFFGDHHEPQLALTANLMYADDDPRRLWFPFFALLQGLYLREGGRYVEGGSQAVTAALAEVIEAAGGELQPSAAVERIAVDAEGRATGVSYRDRTGGICEVQARVLLGNAAPQVLAELLPLERRDAFLARYARLEPSISLFAVALGVDTPPSRFGVGAYSTFVLPDWLSSLDAYPENAPLLGADPGRRLPCYALVDYSRIASGLNNSGVHLLSITGFDRLDNWVGLDDARRRDRRERWMDALVADLERHFPGLASSIVQREMATAQTMQRLLNTPQGAVYGFAPTVERFSHPPSVETAVGNLFLASAFTAGGGFVGALSGGTLAARAALRALAETDGR